jgi:hypothetical protein
MTPSFVGMRLLDSFYSCLGRAHLTIKEEFHQWNTDATTQEGKKYFSHGKFENSFMSGRLARIGASDWTVDYLHYIHYILTYYKRYNSLNDELFTYLPTKFT